MGKKREMEPDESELSSPSKKHKKHKKHKHKKKKDQPDSSLASDPPGGGTVQPAIKLKLKIGGHTVSTTSVNKQEIHRKTPSPEDVSKKTKRTASEEEQEWLEALEAGKLDDNGDVLKKKDEALLTTRQRALLHGPQDDSLLQLPSGYKTQELTEEQVARRVQRATKRREQAKEKREKDKKQTMDRLLKKQESKIKGLKTRGKKAAAPHYRYLQSPTSASISLPQGFNFPLQASTAARSPLPRPSCGVEGCSNLKKYSCSKTGIPLCSLQCYKKNIGINTGGQSTVTV